MKIPLILSISLLAAVLMAQEVSTVNYYFRGNSGYCPVTGQESLKYWSLTKDTYTAPTKLPGSDAVVILDTINTGVHYARLDYLNTATYYAVDSTVNTEMNFMTPLSTISDFTVTAKSDNSYSTDTNLKQLRFAVQTSDFLTVGGDMVLNTTKYFTTRISLLKAGTLRVNGALQFNYLGGADDAGYHAFDMSDAVDTSTGGSFTLETGGLSNTGRTVYVTSAHGINANFIFLNDEKTGTFKGGDFKGVFATNDTVSTTINFSMNADGHQSLTLYKASNTSDYDIPGFGGKKDMAIGNVEVYKGSLDFNSQLAINSVLLDGGSLKLSTFENVGSLTINGGELIYGGIINADSFAVDAIGEIKVVFSAEDLESYNLLIVDFDNLTGDFDESLFVAYDEEGNKLGGEFTKTVYSDYSGSLTYTVPEPATFAALLGIATLLFAARRRAK